MCAQTREKTENEKIKRKVTIAIVKNVRFSQTRSFALRLSSNANGAGHVARPRVSCAIALSDYLTVGTNAPGGMLPST